MTTVKLSIIAAVTLLVSGCNGEPEPETELVADTVPDPVLTDATTQVPLQDMVGGNVTGELTITPFPDSVTFYIMLNGAAPETTYGVRVQPGTCETPGEEVAVLGAVRTGALGNGRSLRSLQEEANQLLDGGHVVAIYAPAAEPGRDRPMACAQIPATR